MRVLAIDTALAACSVAFVDDDRLLAGRHEPLRRGHAERLLPMLEEARRDAGLDYRDLDLIAVTVGPGTFTGVRIGLAAARGLALVHDCPVLGVGTLQALAWGAAEPEPVLVGIDARRGELYWQYFDRDRRPKGPPRLGDAETASAAGAAGDGVLAGSGGVILAGRLPRWRASAAATEPDAAIIALHCPVLGLPEAGSRPSPLYLRAPDAKLPVREAS